jgi:hypothetical protein
LEDCCNTPHTVRGDWYFQDGNAVPPNSPTWLHAFRQNRGPNEFVNGRQSMVQFVSFVSGVDHQQGVVSAVNYQVLLILTLPTYSMPILVSLIKIMQKYYSPVIMLPTVNFDRYPNPVSITPSGPSIAGNTVSY